MTMRRLVEFAAVSSAGSDDADGDDDMSVCGRCCECFLTYASRASLAYASLRRASSNLRASSSARCDASTLASDCMMAVRARRCQWSMYSKCFSVAPGYLTYLAQIRPVQLLSVRQWAHLFVLRSSAGGRIAP